MLHFNIQRLEPLKVCLNPVYVFVYALISIQKFTYVVSTIITITKNCYLYHENTYLKNPIYLTIQNSLGFLKLLLPGKLVTQVHF